MVYKANVSLKLGGQLEPYIVKVELTCTFLLDTRLNNSWKRGNIWMYGKGATEGMANGTNDDSNVLTVARDG